MNILIGQNHLNSIGGSEAFTYTMVKELFSRGHKINLITLEEGCFSKKIESETGIVANKIDVEKFDLTLISHTTAVKMARDKNLSDRIIQTCHSKFNEIEAPSPLAAQHISISEEIDLLNKSRGSKNSKIILNGIDCEKFQIKNPINKRIKKILSLVQSEQGNNFLRKVCFILGCELITRNKNKNPTFDIEDDVNKCDLVVGLGRSAYDSIACGRPVFVWDNRWYQGELGDGFLTPDNFREIVRNNCSGRRYRRKYSAEEFASEIKENYNPESMQYYRDLALTEFNIKKQVNKYLELEA